MKKMLLRLAVALVFAFAAAPALAQQTPAHTVPIGRGAAVQGFHSVLLGSGQLLVGQGTSLDPAAETVTGDCALTSAGVVTCASLNGVAFPASPSVNTVPVLTSTNQVTWEKLPNAALANTATTVNGQTCTLGSSCTVTAAATGVTVGSTTISGGTNGNIEFNNSGVLGEKGVTGSGNVVLATSPSLTTPNIGVATATTVNKVAITAPATGSTLTIPDGVTLTGPAASGTAMTLGNAETVTGAKSFNSGTTIFKGSSSGSTAVNASATASGTLTLPAATDTLVGKATTDTLTNKTFDTAGTGNSFSINGVAATANTGTGAVARAAGPTFTTPTLGAATATTLNKVTITQPATGSTLTIADGKTATVSNTLTLAGTDSTTQTFPATSATIARTDAAQTFTGAQTFSTPVALGSGGSGNSTAAGARSSTGFNIDQATTHGDSNYTILSTDRTTITSATFTALRTWTLPAANSVNAGQHVVIADMFGAINGANTLSVQRAGSDTINGVTSVAITAQYGYIDLVSDGSSKWTYAASSGGGGGSGTVTNATISAGTGISTSGTCSITTSGTCTVALSTPVAVANGGTGTTTSTGTGSTVLSASPALTGSPTAPTQTAGDNSTKIATTAYVDGKGGGGETLLGTFTPTSGTSVTLTSIPAGYNYLRCQLEGVRSSGSPERPQAAVSSDNGSTFGTFFSGNTNGSANTQLWSGEIRFTGVSDTSSKGILVFVSPSNGSFAAPGIGSEATKTGVTNAIRITWVSGSSFTAGTILCYGDK